MSKIKRPDRDPDFITPGFMDVDDGMTWLPCEFWVNECVIAIDKWGEICYFNSLNTELSGMPILEQIEHRCNTKYPEDYAKLVRDVVANYIAEKIILGEEVDE